jgi:hypothetical protein
MTRFCLRIYMLATYLDPRFKDHFFVDKDEFASDLVKWILDDISDEGNARILKQIRRFQWVKQR